jgi:hypothetical protein
MLAHAGTDGRAANQCAEREGEFDWRARLDRLAAFFPWRRHYEHHEGRSSYVSERLHGLVEGRILDVGAGRNATVFSQTFGSDYHPLDLGSSYHIEGRPVLVGPDTVVDLERGPLPFKDRSFDTVICTDVLEHIDNIYHAYDELFRVADRKVIISLPNNWVGFLVSLAAGRHVTHRAGYGLPPFPKGIGERHKYWFNHEEAADFLIRRIPAGFKVAFFDPVFEYGLDSLFTAYRPFALLTRTIEMGNFRRYIRRDYRGAKRVVLSTFGPIVYIVLRPLDIILSGLLWGFGSRTRFYNLFCRQVWVVFERLPDAT